MKDGNEDIDGRVDEVTYYSRALDASEVLQLYEGTLGYSSMEKISTNKDVLVSTDFWEDCDDVLAMRILNWGHRKGFINILGIDICTTLYDGGSPLGHRLLMR